MSRGELLLSLMFSFGGITWSLFIMPNESVVSKIKLKMGG